MNNNLTSFVGTKAGILPTGKLFNYFSFLNQHSQKNVNLLKEKISQSGFLILDKHNWIADIMFTMATLTKNLDIKKMIMPTAAYDMHMPISKDLFSDLNKNGFQILPIFRKMERESIKKNDWRAKYYPKTPTDEQMNQANAFFITESKKTLSTPKECVIVDPFGGPAFYGQKIKRGVMELISVGSPIIFTLSKFDWEKLKFETFISEPIYISSQEKRERVREIIMENFDKLQKLNKVIN